ncbi:MAG: chaperonin GroEL, partial [Candidatus Pacebacteria bacterium]|nr:chaperonin GroEL [Candidatus Paceibacterota bacterium]
DKGMDLKEASIEDLGRADMVKSGKDFTRIVGGKGKKADVAGRVSQIDALIKDSQSEFDIEKFNERKAKLTGGVAVIQVGASTEVEMKNLKERVIDAVAATKSALDEEYVGVIPGGGITLLRAEKALEKLKSTNRDEQAGIDLIKSVLDKPLRKLAENSGEDAGWIVGQIREQSNPNYGFNALTNQNEDLLKAGIIEPAKVAIEALKNAASVASMILTTECLITDAPEGDKPAMPPMGGMPGMM